MKDAHSGLEPKQERFVQEYLLDLNATQAAIRAGYSKKTAQQMGSENLLKPVIKDAIQAAMVARGKRTGIDQDRVLNEWGVLAFSSIWNYRVSDDGKVELVAGVPSEAIRAVSSIKHRIHKDALGNVTREVEIRLWDKNAALKMAGQHLGMFAPKPASPPGNAPLQFEGQVTIDWSKATREELELARDLLQRIADRSGSPKNRALPS